MQAEIIHEEVLTPLDSLAMANPGTLVEYDGHFSLTSTFINGGLGGMIIITLFFVQMTGDASPGILAGALKVTLIPLFYGLIVYFISLIIRIIHKPRI